VTLVLIKDVIAVETDAFHLQNKKNSSQIYCQCISELFGQAFFYLAWGKEAVRIEGGGVCVWSLKAFRHSAFFLDAFSLFESSSLLQSFILCYFLVCFIKIAVY
jgi:hypothetical protein